MSRTFDRSLVEALFGRGLGRALSPRAQERLAAAGIRLHAPWAETYPWDAVIAALAIAAEDLTPGADPAEAHRKLGARLVQGLSSGWKARAALAAARLAGPERSLARLVGPHKTPSNFLTVELKATAPGHYAVALNLGAPHPELLVGLAQALLAELGAAGAAVKLVERGERERLEIALPGR
jgi:uncharacterized protein (TIGR02265 family)